MARRAKRNEDPVVSRLSDVVKLLEDLFILTGVASGMKKGAIREVLSIDKGRVNRISKHFRDRAASD